MGILKQWRRTSSKISWCWRRKRLKKLFSRNHGNLCHQRCTSCIPTNIGIILEGQEVLRDLLSVANVEKVENLTRNCGCVEVMYIII
ncbi:hypothetical protein PO909_016026 [Leuciscus waleckii]